MAATRIAAGGAQHARQVQQAANHAPATGLSAVRNELEHHPRDPFEVDRGQAADGLRLAWGDSYAISVTETGFAAVRRHGQRVTLEAGTPDELVREMREDSAGGAQ